MGKEKSQDEPGIPFPFPFSVFSDAEERNVLIPDMAGVNWLDAVKRRGSYALALASTLRHGSNVPDASKVIVAPSHLGMDTRAEFRRAAVELLDSFPEGSGRLVVDVSLTRLVDSAGLGTLIMVQQHATARKLAVRLRGVSEELRMLLALTKLEEMFEVEQ
jgi:ABC-type transporter Mla MlaB component